MRQLAVRMALLVLVAGALFPETGVRACSTPVFRYTLERFGTDPYEFVVYHRGPLSAEMEGTVAAVEKLPEDASLPVNLKVRKVDLAAAAEKPAWTPPPDAALPWLAVVPPGCTEQMAVWSGPLSAADVRALVDSPARREVVRRLMKGDSAVFLLLESGRQEADRAAAELLRKTVAKLEGSLKLPPDDGTGPPRSRVPLKIAFSVLSLRRDDPAERGLVKLLPAAHAKTAGPIEPIAYPIFGRARILDALSGEMLTAETLQQAGEFLCGDCSCNFKSQMPGVDLLVAANWEAILEGSEISEASPALQGLAPLAAAAASGKSLPAAPIAPAASPDATSDTSDVPPRHGVLFASVAATLAGLALVIAAATFVLKILLRRGAD